MALTGLSPDAYIHCRGTVICGQDSIVTFGRQNDAYGSLAQITPCDREDKDRPHQRTLRFDKCQKKGCLNAILKPSDKEYCVVRLIAEICSLGNSQPKPDKQTQNRKGRTTP
jgi:hypothetical protein